MEPRSYMESQSQRESNARTYPRKFSMAIQKAKGIMLTDTEGKTYYDCLAGAGTLALGHNHPVVIDAIRAALDSELPLHTLDLTTPVKESFVDELFAHLPAELQPHAKIQFCGPSGADAVEAAVKLVKTATGRRSMLSFQGGFHGMTHGALSLTGNLGPKRAIPGMMSEVHFLPYPYAYRCPFGIGAEGHKIGSTYIERLLDDPESGIVKPAGLIVEAVQGEGGVIPAPVEWLQEIRRITKERDIPLIVDEIQAGLGRTGKMFAFEHAGIVPDVIIISKAIGGSLPLSVVVYHEKLDQWLPGAHTGTFRGNQLAMAAGLATLKYIQANRLAEQAVERGAQLMSRLLDIGRANSIIGEVRGRGLMVGVEMVDRSQPADRIGAYPAHPEAAKQVQKECFDRGLILELGGRHGSVVRFLPPLIITEEQIEVVCTIFANAVSAVEERSGLVGRLV